MDNEDEKDKSSDLNATEDWPATVGWLVLHIIIPLLRGDHAVASQLCRFGDGMVVKGSYMTFTLPALHNFVRQARGRPSDRDDFSEFRRALYRFGVNQILRENGGVVVAVGSDDDPVRRLYRLQRTDSS